jgi:hypothetical protein
MLDSFHLAYSLIKSENLYNLYNSKKLILKFNLFFVFNLTDSARNHHQQLFSSSIQNQQSENFDLTSSTLLLGQIQVINLKFYFSSRQKKFNYFLN